MNFAVDSPLPLRRSLSEVTLVLTRKALLPSLFCSERQATHSQPSFAWIPEREREGNAMSVLPRGLKATVLSHSTNPYLNLALETHLFTTHPQTHILLFYRNRPTVVIGRNQNPFSQVNLPHVDFLRRFSGGGTVYHDLGNVNFSVRMPRQEFKRKLYAEMVVRAIERKNVMNCRVTDRGDIVMVSGDSGYKVSGSAYKISKDIAYHHGTMLLDSNLNELRRALKIEKRIMIRDKGVDSIRANHVANIPFPGKNSLTKFQEFAQVVKDEFEEMHGKHRFFELSEQEIQAIPEIKKIAEQLSVLCIVIALINRAGIGSLDKLQSLPRDWSSMERFVIFECF
jgi:lipoyltransferase/lipoate-protein ligase